MDILTEKSTKQYDTLSRYSSFYTYYNTLNNKYIYGLTSPLSTEGTYVLHQVSEADTLESLAFKYFGRPDYFWVVAMFNDIDDAFINLYDKFKTIKIPSISNIFFEDSRR